MDAIDVVKEILERYNFSLTVQVSDAFVISSECEKKLKEHEDYADILYSMAVFIMDKFINGLNIETSLLEHYTLGNYDYYSFNVYTHDPELVQDVVFRATREFCEKNGLISSDDDVCIEPNIVLEIPSVMEREIEGLIKNAGFDDIDELNEVLHANGDMITVLFVG